MFSGLPAKKKRFIDDYIRLLDKTQPWSLQRLLGFVRLRLRRYGRLRTLRLFTQVMNLHPMTGTNQGNS